MSATPVARSMARDLIALATSLAACFAVAGLGGYWTSLGLGPWYDGLRKPWWTAPDWLFGPILTSGACGAAGSYYIVNAGGATSLDGTNAWSLGDWTICGGSGAWQRAACPSRSSPSNWP